MLSLGNTIKKEGSSFFELFSMPPSMGTRQQHTWLVEGWCCWWGARPTYLWCMPGQGKNTDEGPSLSLSYSCLCLIAWGAFAVVCSWKPSTSCRYMHCHGGSSCSRWQTEISDSYIHRCIQAGCVDVVRVMIRLKKAVNRPWWARWKLGAREKAFSVTRCFFKSSN
jgi:hypothetical protein